MKVILLFLVLCVLACKSAIEGNGGTQLGVSGDSFAILASDRKLIDSYSIKSKDVARLCQIDEGLILSTAGSHADGLAITSILKSAVAKYEFENGKKIHIEALSNLLSSLLYVRRFSPYSCICAVAGIDKGGKGALYRYDPVGSFERVPAFAVGNGGHYIQPTLDELVDRHCSPQTDGDPSSSVLTGLSSEEAVSRIVSMYRAAADREITVGRELDVCIVESEVEEPVESPIELSSPRMVISTPFVRRRHSVKQILVKL